MVEGNSVAKSDPSKHRLVECFKRGVHLANHDKNFEYAHEMFAECVRNDSGNLQFVEAMIRNLREWRPKERKWHLPRRNDRVLNKAVQNKDWALVVGIGIDRLKERPWDTQTLRAMADASAAQHQNEVELVYLKQALDAEPKNVDVNRHCGRSLARMGQFDQAIACWHRVELLKRSDVEAQKMISMLALEKLKYPDGRPPAITSKPASVEHIEPEDATKEIALTPRQKIEKAIARDPTNVANYLELADLLVNTKQFDAAETLLVSANIVCKNHKAIATQLIRVRTLRSDSLRKIAEDSALEKDSAETAFSIPWLPIAWIVAVVVFALLLKPSAAAAIWKSADVRDWNRLHWFVFNAFVLGMLVCIRFASNLRTLIRRSRPKYHRPT